MFTRHECKLCRSIVFPGSKFEASTIAPELGRSGREVLLRSFNQTKPSKRHKKPVTMAWCFSCRRWVECNKLGEVQLRQKYLARGGVVTRRKQRRKAS